MENWTLATSGSMGGLVPVLQPRSGSFEKKKAPRVRMGGGFCAHSPPRSFSSDRVRPSRQLYHPTRNDEAFVSRSMRTKGLVPTLPDGTQPRPKVFRGQNKSPSLQNKSKKSAPGQTKLTESHRVSRAVNKLSAEYIDNLQMQIQILEKEIEVTKLKSVNDMALLRSTWGDGEIARKKLTERPKAVGILSHETPEAMQKWLRAFFSRHSKDPRIVPHRDAVLSAFWENMVTGPDAVTLSTQELRDELNICSLAVRKLLISEIAADDSARRRVDGAKGRLPPGDDQLEKVQRHDVGLRVGAEDHVRSVARASEHGGGEIVALGDSDSEHHAAEDSDGPGAESRGHHDHGGAEGPGKSGIGDTGKHEHK